MNFIFKFAWRYLFARRSVNVINLITGLSVFGLGIGAAAVILVLSVFNGFEQVIAGMFSQFNPEIKILPARGKTFAVDSLPLEDIRGFPQLTAVSLTVEEKAFFELGDSRAFGIVKGVDEMFSQTSLLDSVLLDGAYTLDNQEGNDAIIGLGLRNKLRASVGGIFDPITVYAAKKNSRGALDKPFRIRSVNPKATFAIQQDYDQQYLITTLPLAQQLLGLNGRVSALELAVEPSADATQIADDLQASLGPTYTVLDRMEQDADLLRLMNVEKWLSYIILSLVLLLVSFNLIGGLWLIVLEKKRDIAILRAMGTTTSTIWKIFMAVGLLLALIGAGFGIALALLLYWAQVNYGLVPVPPGMVISAYPIELRAFDVLIVLLTVLLIGLLASWPAARRASGIDAADLAT